MKALNTDQARPSYIGDTTYMPATTAAKGALHTSCMLYFYEDHSNFDNPFS